MNLLQTQLLELLADGQFHSGEALGNTLGVSRMAVHKRIDGLHALGLDIFRVNRKGYRLAQPIQLLDKASILSQLPGTISDLHVHHITSSTNDDLRLLIKQKNVKPGLS